MARDRRRRNLQRIPVAESFEDDAAGLGDMGAVDLGILHHPVHRGLAVEIVGMRGAERRDPAAGLGKGGADAGRGMHKAADPCRCR